MSSRAAAERCSRCGEGLEPGAPYQFQAPDGLIRKCLPCALMPRPMHRRSGRIAIVVGTILTAINQGDVLLAGRWSPALAWKLPLTYAVPFIVATLGALGTGKMPDGR